MVVPPNGCIFRKQDMPPDRVNSPNDLMTAPD